MWPADAPRPTTTRSVAESANNRPGGLIGSAGFIENVAEERKVTTLAPIHPRRLAAALLLAFAALLGSHGTAQAQTDVWSATLTVGAAGSVFGFGTGFGTLSDTTITVGTTNYTIDGISIAGGALYFRLFTGTDFGTAVTHLVLHVGTQTFPFSEASFGSARAYFWTSNVPSWSENDSVSLSITAFAVPDAPTNLTATAGDQQVDLSWTAPASDGGTMITDYEYEQNGSGTWTSTGVTTTSYTVRNLTNGQSYTFKVRAVNSVGESTASAASSSVTPATVPGAPTGLSATAGNQQVALSWTAPTSNGGATITDYEYSQNGSATWTSTGGTATSYTVQSLTNGQSYSFRVRAVNRVGESTASAASSSVTPATVPGAPTGLSATVGDQQVELSWTAPASNGGATILRYEYEQGLSGTWTSTGGTATSFTVRNLTNGQSYTFRVRAVNRVGAGAASSAQSGTPTGTPGAPDAPHSLSATAGNRQVMLSWAQHSGGAAVTRYEYEQDNSGTWISTGGTATSYTVRNLTNGQSYTFRVRAVNSAGASGASNSQFATPTATVPDAPTGLSARPGNEQVTLTWRAPASDGGAPITRYEYEQDSSGTWTSTGGAGTSYTVRDLTNGQLYRFRVRAVNGLGPSGASNQTTATPALRPTPPPPPPTNPDLEVQSPSVNDNSPVTGATFTLAATVRNAGDGEAAATTLRYFRSEDATITPDDTAEGTAAVRRLAASATSSESIDLTAPSTAGTYYYGACVDAVRGESNTANNCSAAVEVEVEAPPPPSPPTVEIVGLPAEVDGGSRTTLWAVASDPNDDPLTYEWEATVGVLYKQGARIIGWTAPAATEEAVEVTITVTVSDGMFDATASAVTTIRAREPEAAPPTNPDLEVQSPSVSDSSPATGATFTLSATVRNAGGGESAATALRFFRSEDATITPADTAEGTAAVAGLAASGRYLGSVDLTAPATAGTYYYGACVDAVPDESDITNNCSASVPVTVPEPVPALPLIGQLLLALGLLGGGGFVIGYRRPQR